MSRAEEQTTAAVTAIQASGNCSWATERPMKMTRRGMTIGRIWAVTSWPTGEEETGADSGCFQLAASRMTRKQGSIQKRSPQLAEGREVRSAKRYSASERKAARKTKPRTKKKERSQGGREVRERKNRARERARSRMM